MMVDHPEHIQLAVSLGLRVRQQAEALEKQICCGSGLAGACAVCSYWLWRALELVTPGQFVLVRGVVGPFPYGEHCWLEDPQGVVVDPTATQFFSTAAKVEVMSNYTAYSVRKYRPEKRGRQVVREFPTWWTAQQPSKYRHRFLPLVRKLVQELSPPGTTTPSRSLPCPAGIESNWMSPLAARS